MIAARLAWRDLRGGLRGFRIFLACLALGVAAIAAVGSLRSAIEAGLAREGAALLGGDASVEFTYRFANETERAWMNEIATHVSETVDFRSMLVIDDGTTREQALTQLRAVDDAYPLVGEVVLDPPIPLAEALAGGDLPGLVTERILADRLGLTPGDTVTLGTQDFTLTALLTRFPDNTTGGLSLGPRSIVLTDALAQSGLIGPGTLYSTDYRMTLPDNADLSVLKTQAQARFADSGMRWRDARAGAPGISEFVDRLGAFLVLIGLSSLAVGGVGISAAVQSYLAGKARSIATLKTLGASRRVIFASYGLQISALSLLGVIIGLVLGAGMLIAIAPVLSALLPVPAQFGLYARPLIEAASYGLLTAALFSLAPLARAQETRPAALFRDTLAGGRTWPSAPILLAMALLLAALIGLASWFSQSWELTLATFAGLAVTLLVLAGLGALVTRAARTAHGRARGPLRWALAAMGQRGSETGPVILSLGLGLSVLASIGQVDGALRGAIQGNLPQIAPSYFVVDIQPNQIDAFRQRVETDPGVSKMEAAPMLRGIITRINGQPAREVAGDHWVIQGDRGVTYAPAPPPGTNITEGSWWPEGYTGPNQISFAAEQAQELGLSLGDTLTVNILGRDIEGQITSFREVKFETAGIGFVMAMNPAALAGAPHSWIASIYADEAAEAALIRDISRANPNITAIRVRDGIDRAAEILGGIAQATRYGAAVSLATGLLVLIGAALAAERARRYEAAILKTLGATRGQILRSFAWRAALAGVAAALVALAAGIAGGWAVARLVMQVPYTVIWSNAAWILALGVGLSLLAGLGFALRPLAAKPARILRAQD